MALAARGDVDVVLVHAPDREIEFVRDGFGVNRKYVMYNDFVDPRAGGRSSRHQRVERRRGCVSANLGHGVDLRLQGGTNRGHISRRCRYGPRRGSGDLENREWRLSVGQGMGGTLTTANEKGAYTLSDRGTFLAREDLDLVILAEGDEVLFNP